MFSNKTSSLISIIGLSLSIAVVIVLTFFVIQEKSYDKAYPNIDNIYEVVTTKNESFVEEDAKDILFVPSPPMQAFGPTKSVFSPPWRDKIGTATFGRYWKRVLVLYGFRLSGLGQGCQVSGKNKIYQSK